MTDVGRGKVNTSSGQPVFSEMAEQEVTSASLEQGTIFPVGKLAGIQRLMVKATGS